MENDEAVGRRINLQILRKSNTICRKALGSHSNEFFVDHLTVGLNRQLRCDVHGGVVKTFFKTPMRLG